MDIIERAHTFEKSSLKALTTSDRVKISREAKEIILGVNEIYKKNKDKNLLELMKRITVIKKRVEKRLLKTPRV